MKYIKNQIKIFLKSNNEELRINSIELIKLIIKIKSEYILTLKETFEYLYKEKNEKILLIIIEIMNLLIENKIYKIKEWLDIFLFNLKSNEFSNSFLNNLNLTFLINILNVYNNNDIILYLNKIIDICNFLISKGFNFFSSNFLISKRF
jgi:hypothetical protein